MWNLTSRGRIEERHTSTFKSADINFFNTPHQPHEHTSAMHCQQVKSHSLQRLLPVRLELVCHLLHLLLTHVLPLSTFTLQLTNIFSYECRHASLNSQVSS